VDKNLKVKNVREIEDDEEEQGETKILGFDELSYDEKIQVIENKYEEGIKKGLEYEQVFDSLPVEEKLFVYQVKELEKQKAIDKQVELERIAQEEKQKVLEEFSKASQDEKINADVKGKHYGPGGLQEFLAKQKLERTKKKAMKKGGEIIIKGHMGKGYELIWSSKPIKYVEFLSKNEQGEEVRNITRITKTKGHLRGSSIPVHLCLEGVANSIDPFEGIETNMSAEYFNKLLQGEFQSGLATGLAIKPNKSSGLDMAKLTPILLIGVIGALGVIAYYQMQLFEMVSKLAGA